MQRLTILMLLSLLALQYVAAQEANNDNTIYINSSGDNVTTNKDGGLALTLNGMRINFGSSHIEMAEQRTKRVEFGCFGIDSPKYNHFAAIELGSNLFPAANYSMYSDEEASQLAFTQSKSVYLALNVLTMNVILTKSRSLAASMAIGFTCENFVFARDYTMERRDGMMHAVALDPNIKKSKLSTSSIHIPITLDWNIGKGWFLSAGVNIDILMSSNMVYKKPRTTIEGVATLRPVQVGVTARAGWRRLYGFVNYSPMEMFKPGTGPKIYKMSAGAGFWF
ncbi:MAG: outer membrane beta-barrel protein [Alistipes sp.]|nr:outer membrane beta-barrel protein [Alistipes sp.]